MTHQHGDQSGQVPPRFYFENPALDHMEAELVEIRRLLQDQSAERTDAKQALFAIRRNVSIITTVVVLVGLGAGAIFWGVLS